MMLLLEIIGLAVVSSSVYNNTHNNTTTTTATTSEVTYSHLFTNIRMIIMSLLLVSMVFRFSWLRFVFLFELTRTCIHTHMFDWATSFYNFNKLLLLLFFFIYYFYSSPSRLYYNNKIYTCSCSVYKLYMTAIGFALQLTIMFFVFCVLCVWFVNFFSLN